jgi:hypothetical protein
VISAGDGEQFHRVDHQSAHGGAIGQPLPSQQNIETTFPQGIEGVALALLGDVQRHTTALSRESVHAFEDPGGDVAVDAQAQRPDLLAYGGPDRCCPSCERAQGFLRLGK